MTAPRPKRHQRVTVPCYQVARKPVTQKSSAWPGPLANDNPQQALELLPERDGASLVNIGDVSAYTQTLRCGLGPVYWTGGACP